MDSDEDNDAILRDLELTMLERGLDEADAPLWGQSSRGQFYREEARTSRSRQRTEAQKERERELAAKRRQAKAHALHSGRSSSAAQQGGASPAVASSADMPASRSRYEQVVVTELSAPLVGEQLFAGQVHDGTLSDLGDLDQDNDHLGMWDSWDDGYEGGSESGGDDDRGGGDGGGGGGGGNGGSGSGGGGTGGAGIGGHGGQDAAPRTYQQRRLQAAAAWQKHHAKFGEALVASVGVQAGVTCTACLRAEPGVVVECVGCGNMGYPLLCASCDAERHPYAHWHERCSVVGGYKQPIAACQQFDSTGALVEVPKFFAAMLPCECSASQWDFRHADPHTRIIVVHILGESGVPGGCLGQFVAWVLPGCPPGLSVSSLTPCCLLPGCVLV
jgi:hypothetical protein